MTTDRHLPRGQRRDEGTVLMLVLVLIVLSALIVLPIMSYGVTVLRANQVVGERGARAEAVKAGFRYAMAEPYDLYDTCGSAGLNNGVTLPTPHLDIPTTTKCYLLDTASANESGELPYGIVTTYVGKPALTGAGIEGGTYPGSGAGDADDWIAAASTTRAPFTVWLPNLPVKGLNLRSGGGHAMPPEYALNGYSECTVYFPGTYRSEVELDGPTFFTSGIYYFERPVRVVGGADVVAGEGSFQGCTDSQYAVFYAENAPATHNVTGLGATFVFGDEGRLVVDDSSGDVRFRMNQRYVPTEDTGTAPSAKVSIMTVNGELDEALEVTDFENSGLDLVLPGPPATPELIVPLSPVDSVDPRPAPVDQYRPSTLTPAPRAPTSPLDVSGVPYREAAIVSWNAPESDGGLPITEYVVTSSPDNATCVTTGATTCAIEGLSNGVNYTFRVVATNTEGSSDPSEPSSNVRPSSGNAWLTVPAAPTFVAIEEADPSPMPGVSRYGDALVVEWTPVAGANAAPTREYQVTVTDTTTSETHTCTTVDDTSCAITELPPPDSAAVPSYPAEYDVSVVARNIVGTSTVATLTGVSLPAAGETYVAPTPAQHPPYVPPAVVDIDLATATSTSEVVIPGYISAPQGLVSVEGVSASVVNPAPKTVRIEGGVLSAWAEVTEPRPDKFVFGLTNPKTQRIIRLETTVEGSNITSQAIIQLNESGGWAVNSWVVQ